MNTDWPSQLVNSPGKPLFSAMPENLGLEITGHCQLNCRHCFNESGPHNRQELPLEIIERLLDEMVTWGHKTIRISGGEPTLHESFRAVVDACKKRTIGVVLNSHGVYGRGLLKWLCSAPVDRFLISMDGLKKRHEAIRGKGTFDRTVASCRILCEAGQKVCISFHAGSSNQYDLVGLIKLAADMGADFKLSPIRPLGRAIHELPGELIQPEQFAFLVQEVTRLRQLYPDIRLFTDFDILENRGRCPQKPALTSCKAGRTMVNVSYRGDIYPCAFFDTADRRFSAGNVYHNSIAEVWGRSRVFEPFRIQTKAKACQSCGHYQRSCAGGCPAVAHFTTGYLDAPDPTCFAHLLMETSEEHS